RELDRSGPSYSVDTLATLRAEQGDRPLVLLIGMDAFTGLSRWHRWRELLQLAHVGVLRRPGFATELPPDLAEEVDGRRTTNRADIEAAPAGRVMELDVTPLEVSATRIRQLLAEGRDPRYLLPAGLFDEPRVLQPYRAGP